MFCLAGMDRMTWIATGGEDAMRQRGKLTLMIASLIISVMDMSAEVTRPYEHNHNTTRRGVGVASGALTLVGGMLRRRSARLWLSGGGFLWRHFKCLSGRDGRRACERGFKLVRKLGIVVQIKEEEKGTRGQAHDEV